MMAEEFRVDLVRPRYWRALYRAAVAVCCMSCFDASPVNAFQAQIRDIHVTQGVQSVKWDAGNPHGFAPQTGNTVPLIQNRSTEVRVLIDVQLSPGEMPPQFVGELDIMINGQLINGIPIQAANQPFSPPTSPDIRNENDSLNFVLRPLVLRFPRGDDLESNDVDFVVRIRPGPGGQPEITGTASDLTLVRLPKVEFAAVPVRWMPTNSAPEPAFIAPGRGDAFLAAGLPIADTCFWPEVCVLGMGTAFEQEDRPYRVVQGFTHDVDLNGDGKISTNLPGDDGEVSSLLESLETWRNFCFQGGGAFCPGLSVDRLLFMYGWLPGAAIGDFAGIALPGANLAVGFDLVSAGQGSIAHEFGHMLGLVQGGPGSHNPCPATNPNWPNCPEFDLSPNVGLDVLGRLVNNPPGPLPPAGNGNGVTERIKGFNFHDLMNPGGGGPIRLRWLTIPTYLAMLEELKARDPRRTVAERVIPGDIAVAGAPVSRVGPTLIPVSLRSSASSEVPSREQRSCLPTLRITGLVTKFEQTSDDRPVAREATLRPAFQSDRCWQPSSVGTRASQLLAEVTMQQDGRDYTLTVPIDARMIIDWIIDPKDPGEPRESIELGPFQASVPVLGRVMSLRLLDPSKRRTFAQLKRTAAKPKITIVTPKPGSRLARETTVRWSVADADSKPSDFLYHVAYSPDGGANFFPVAVNKRDTQITFDATAYLPSDAEGVLRIYTSDGLNTATADVDRLTNAALR